MAPLATKNFKQTQTITTGLRIICESYPANTCIREILQNGDDVGATEIEYTLDIKPYLNSPLWYDALQAYHGPVLLVILHYVPFKHPSFYSHFGEKTSCPARERSFLSFESFAIYNCSIFTDEESTEIEYVGDTKSYLSGVFFYDTLQACYGPVLLVRSNSIFTDEDFGSLSSRL